MFSKNSRYRKLPNIVITDAAGRQRSSKALRLLPGTSGVMEHTIEQGERLDHLAYKYYLKPTRWWHICDANPEYKFPLELLGHTPLVIMYIRLLAGTDPPPWNSLHRALQALVGVEDVAIIEERSVVQAGTGYTTEADRAVQVVYNKLNLSLNDIVTTIETLPFTVEGVPAPVGRVGKKINIPPDSVD